MANDAFGRLEMITSYQEGQWLLTGAVVDRVEPFPTEVFLWTIDVDGSLLDTTTIGHIDELTNAPSYDTTWTNNFGKRRCKYETGRRLLPTMADVDQVKTVWKAVFEQLQAEVSEAVDGNTEYFPAKPPETA